MFQIYSIGSGLNQSTAPFITAIATICGVLIGGLLNHLIANNSRRLAERTALRDIRIDKAEEILSDMDLFREETSLAIAKWMMIRTMEQLEVAGPEMSPFRKSKYRSIKAKCKLWFPDTLIDFQKFDDEMADIESLLEQRLTAVGVTDSDVVSILANDLSRGDGVARTLYANVEDKILKNVGEPAGNFSTL